MVSRLSKTDNSYRPRGQAWWYIIVSLYQWSAGGEQARPVSLTSWGHSHVSTFSPPPGRCFSALKLLNESCLKYLFMSWQPELEWIPNLGGIKSLSLSLCWVMVQLSVCGAPHTVMVTLPGQGVEQWELYRNCAQKGRCPGGFSCHSSAARALGVEQWEFYRNCAQKGLCPWGFQLSQLQWLRQSDGTQCPQRLCPRTRVRLWPQLQNHVFSAQTLV